jgi:hypothetical protein
MKYFAAAQALEIIRRQLFESVSPPENLGNVAPLSKINLFFTEKTISYSLCLQCS